MRRIIVTLDGYQLAAIRPMRNEISDMAEDGKPGMLLAQIQGHEMSVFVANHEQGKAIQALFGRPVGKTTGGKK
jgi:hypothetical protein